MFLSPEYCLISDAPARTSPRPASAGTGKGSPAAGTTTTGACGDLAPSAPTRGTSDAKARRVREKGNIMSYYRGRFSFVSPIVGYTGKRSVYDFSVKKEIFLLWDI